MYYGHVYDKFNLNVLEIGGSKYSTKILRSSGHVLWKILRKRLQLNLKRTEYRPASGAALRGQQSARAVSYLCAQRLICIFGTRYSCESLYSKLKVPLGFD
jgi:hypothetical protein